MKSQLMAVVIVCSGGFGGVGAEELRMDPKTVDRDFKVTVDVSMEGDKGAFVVVGNLSEGAIRIPVLLKEGVDYVVEVVAPIYKRNTSSVLKPAVEIRVMDPGKLVAKGEDGTEPLTVLSCHRAINWEAPQAMKILQSPTLTISLTIVPAVVPEPGGPAEVGSE